MRDEGYFPRGSSVLRRVHEERAVGLLYGQRALGIGAIAPLNFIGTLRHTRARDMPFQRLVPTPKAFATIFFCSRGGAGGGVAGGEPPPPRGGGGQPPGARAG